MASTTTGRWTSRGTSTFTARAACTCTEPPPDVPGEPKLHRPQPVAPAGTRGVPTRSVPETGILFPEADAPEEGSAREAPVRAESARPGERERLPGRLPRPWCSPLAWTAAPKAWAASKYRD